MKKIAEELVVMAKDIMGEETDPMAGERLSHLFTIFHTWATRKGTSLPPGAPVATQILDGMNAVENTLRGKMGLTGTPAVKALMGAMARHFTMDAAPIPMLIRKYGIDAIRNMASSRLLNEMR